PHGRRSSSKYFAASSKVCARRTPLPPQVPSAFNIHGSGCSERHWHKSSKLFIRRVGGTRIPYSIAVLRKSCREVSVGKLAGAPSDVSISFASSGATEHGRRCS